ncbi:STAS domain-containing protein [Synechococcus sp. CS-1325]|uniref:SulP family inorganic anion transporter n=1 Tax=unclassified Synechococcus TaxID=2626047 RepID=UPI000DB3275E|nr:MULTISPECIES: SulP family inorganic anion transporter [unclassified Synechococcus]PZV00754.1 MAG: sodium-independent anion transporter [Cyanobium sp.]MCT0198910.1 STAS domain-containing protein [Synechococcus sp. CS-1325]MCT0214559.1 STAS domain-containing protein [Synechococcus sp. CS-1326]MCT0230889.1 STAS domain-containing protein [Synechococcus sp. CS-1324]MCT0233893.1 STAS domain-containing protein [Synechococcus sp. CS-1327]
MSGSAFLPWEHWIRRYRPEWRRSDLLAGLTTAAVVLPKAMAFATIAGLPVEVGLYTALVPMLVYALLGSSRPLSVSTTTTLAILVGAELNRVVPGAAPAELLVASATLAALVGAMLLLAALLRLGFVANFISESVLVGFKSGIGLVIVVDQLPKLLGVPITRAGFFADIGAVVGQLPQTSLPTVVLSLLSIGLLLSLPRLAPGLPAPLAAIAVALAAMALFKLEALGVATVGPVSPGLPGLTLPQLALAQRMWPAAAGIALMSFTESIAAGRAFASSKEPQPRPNQELFALGLANIGGALLGGMAAGGGTTQTAVNRRAGARSQLAELVTAAVAMGTLLLLAPLIARLPLAVLAAVVVVYSAELIAPADFIAIRRVRVTEFHWALIACAGVALLGTLRGILVAVIVSLLALAQQEMNPRVYVLARKRGTDVFRPRLGHHPAHPDDQTWPGLLLLRAEGRLFFANAQAVWAQMEALIERAEPRVVVIDCSAVIDIEYSALKRLTEAERKQRKQGVSLWLAGLNPDSLRVVRHSELGRTLGPERLCFNVETAVERYEAGSAPTAMATLP